MSENTTPDTPNFGLIWTSGLRAINSVRPGAYTADTFPGIVHSYLHRALGHAVVVGPRDDPLIQSLVLMAHAHLRLSWREGRFFVHGIVPRTASLVLLAGDNVSPYHLLRVV